MKATPTFLDQIVHLDEAKHPSAVLKSSSNSKRSKGTLFLTTRDSLIKKIKVVIPNASSRECARR